MADMKDKKLNDNEMEQVSGGDVLDVLLFILEISSFFNVSTEPS